MIEAIKFPAIAFGHNFILICKVEDQLTTCSEKGLKSGCYKDMLVVDSKCDCFEIIDAKKIAVITPLWKYLLWSSKIIKVSFCFNPMPSMPLEQIKKKLCDCIERDQDFWEEAAEIEEIKASIEKCNSFEEICHNPYLTY